MSVKIDKEKVVYLSRICLDPLGPVVKYGEHVFKIIENSKRDYVENFLDSPFYFELQKEKLIIEAKINDEFIWDENHFLLESILIPYISRSSTWTFTMLKDVVITVLKILIICEKYDYNLIDGHTANVIFDYTHPVWCDFGSFIKKQNSQQYISGEYEFLRTMYWPLTLWAKGHDYLANLVLSDPMYARLEFSERFTILKYTHKVFTFLRRLYNYLIVFIMPHRNDMLVKPNIWFYNFLLKRIMRLTPSISNTFWTNYQDDITKLPNRFEEIGDLVKKNCPGICSSIDLAGNRGELTKFLIKKNIINWGISIDYDIGAVDRLYCSIRGTFMKIFPACGNIIAWEDKNDKPQADIALATAVSHHLLLTQKIPIDFMFSEIKRFSKKYVLIEFMPLGLWDGHTSPPIPNWYTEEWFQKEFTKFFDLITKKQLERNRIAYLGKIIRSRYENT